MRADRVRFTREIGAGSSIGEGCVLWLLLIVLGSGIRWISAESSRVLSGHVPSVVSSLLQVAGRLPATQRLNLAIGLPLRNKQTLTRLIARIYDPADPSYHHYLTPSQFAAAYGPTEEGDYKSLVRFSSAPTISKSHGIATSQPDVVGCQWHSGGHRKSLSFADASLPAPEGNTPFLRA